MDAIHSVLATRRRSDAQGPSLHVYMGRYRHRSLAVRGCVYAAICTGALVQYAVHLVEEILRFVLVFFVVIPSLAVTFILLGMFFHAPRILLTYMCGIVVSYCWQHVRTPNPARGVKKPKSPEAHACERCCMSCRLASYLCGHSMQCAPRFKCCQCGACVHPKGASAPSSST